MRRLLDVEPDFNVVLRGVDDVLAAEWPRRPMTASDWLKALGLGPTAHDDRFPNWGTGTPGWGDAQTCLAVLDGDLVGLGWFLWRGAQRAWLWRNADYVRHGLEDRFGPCHASPGRPTSYRCHWVAGTRRIELVAVLDETVGPREVQVHVMDAAHEEDCKAGCGSH